MRRILFAVFLVVACATGAAADSFENAVAAFQRGDDALATQLFRPLAEQGHPKAQYHLGLMYIRGQGVLQDYQEALQWFHKAAALDYPQAQYNLGVMYANGHGAPQNYSEALKWYRKAAEQGLAQAQYNLGVMYFHRLSTPRDALEALKWHHKAAEQGLAQAQGNLGALYEYGYGIRQDLIRAHMWYSIAVIRLSEDDGKTVMKLRDSVASQLTAAQIGKAEELARRCQKYVFKICG